MQCPQNLEEGSDHLEPELLTQHQCLDFIFNTFCFLCQLLPGQADPPLLSLEAGGCSAQGIEIRIAVFPREHFLFIQMSRLWLWTFDPLASFFKVRIKYTTFPSLYGAGNWNQGFVCARQVLSLPTELDPLQVIPDVNISVPISSMWALLHRTSCECLWKFFFPFWCCVSYRPYWNRTLPPGWLQELYVYRQSPEVEKSLSLEIGSWAFHLFIRQPVASGLQLVWGRAGAKSQVAPVGLDLAT